MSPSGQAYYYNHATRESSWTFPSPTPSPAHPPPAPHNAPNSSGSAANPIPGTPWQRFPQPDGRQHFPSAATNQASWKSSPEVTNSVPPGAPPRLPGPHNPGHPPVAPSQANGPAVRGPQRPPPLSPPPLARPPPPLRHPHMPAPQMVMQPSSHGGTLVPPMHAGMWRPWMGMARPPGGPSHLEQEAAAAEAVKAAKRKFRQMLVEHEVNEFSRWEKACKKFDSDPRHAYLPLSLLGGAGMNSDCLHRGAWPVLSFALLHPSAPAAQRTSVARREYPSCIPGAWRSRQLCLCPIQGPVQLWYM